MQKLKSFFSKRQTAPPSPVAEPEIQPPESPPLTETETAAATAPLVSPLTIDEEIAIIPELLEEPPAPETLEEPPKTTSIARPKEKLPSSDYIRVEPTLETSGCFPATKERFFRTGEDAARIVHLPNGIRMKYSPNAVYGDVNAWDFDMYRAVQKEIFEQCEKIEVFNPATGKTEIQYKLPPYIATSITKLLKNAGKHISQRSFAEAKKSLKRMQGFLIEMYGKHRLSDDFMDFNGTIFYKVLMHGDLQEDGGKADKVYIWLSDWSAQSFKRGHHKLLDVALHRQLSKPIAKVLYPLLEQGFFASHKNGGTYWEKSYLDLCRDHLFVQPHSTLSYVKRQLDPAHKQLQDLGVISSWEYRESSNVWLVIRYHAGDKFRSDQKERKRRAETVKKLETRKRAKRGKLSQREEELVQRAVDLGNDPDNIRVYQHAIRIHGASIFESGLGDAKDLILRNGNTGTRGACIMDCINRVAHARQSAKSHARV